MPVDIRQTSVDAVVPDRQFGVIDSQQVQDRGVDVVDLGRVFSVGGFETKLIAGAVRDPALDAATRQPICEAIGIVIAAFAALRTRHATEFGRPEHDRIFEQTQPLEIVDQCGRSDGHS